MNTVTKSPRAEININEITKTVHEAALCCYGIVGLSDKASISRIDNIIKKGTKEDAIFITKRPNQNFIVDVYLVLAKDVKITEALVSAQDTIKYCLDKQFAKKCVSVNVFAESVSLK